jgi:hypothetical protein
MVWGFLCSVVLAGPHGFVHRPISEYRDESRIGFTVLVSPDAMSLRSTTQALSLIEAQLRNVMLTLPQSTAKDLRRMKIFVERNNPDFSCACYHASRDWLSRRGYPMEKHGSIEIANVGNFVRSSKENQPMLVLHELAHAYHHQLLGSQHPGIQAAYDRAVAKGLYGEVPYSLGGKRPHYGGSNAWEYFAELTETYFGQNDYFPFNRDQLAQYDPDGYALVKRLWTGS